MPSITSWIRLEPRARSETMSTSLQARIHDPLWLLARQWQFGEFLGEDAASPVKAELKTLQSQLERYCPGSPDSARAQDYDGRIPLETQVERESVLTRSDAGFNPRLAAEAGLHFLRLLGSSLTAKYKPEFLKHYALTPPSSQVLQDSASLRFISLLAGRVLNGATLYGDLAPLRTSGQPIVLPNKEPFTKIDSGDRTTVSKAVDQWLDWYEAFFREPQGNTTAWVPDQLEYRFAVAAPALNSSGAQAELVMVASEYYEGHLDWQAFEIDTQHKLTTKGKPSEPDPLIVIPTPIRFRGMPAARLWEFEDAGVNLGAVEAAPEDLARLLLAEFALLYGNDHFVVPVELPVGSICQVKSLFVTNTFGETTEIKPASQAAQATSGAIPWRMFCLSTLEERVGKQAAPLELLFLPPVLGWNIQGASIEEVLFLRDEMANMAWAVERIVESPVGGALNRFEANQMERSRKEQEDPDSTTPRSGSLIYQLASSVPPYWFSLVPKHTGSSNRDVILSLSGEPLGRILTASDSVVVNEEEVPREGARVTRAFQYARWTDGSTHLWIGRRKETGRGEGSSGLRFDIVEPT